MQANWLYISLPSIPAVHAPLAPSSLASTLDSVRFSPHSHALAHRAHNHLQKGFQRESRPKSDFIEMPCGHNHPPPHAAAATLEGECALARPATALEGINLSMGRMGANRREDIRRIPREGGDQCSGCGGRKEGSLTHNHTHVHEPAARLSFPSSPPSSPPPFGVKVCNCDREINLRRYREHDDNIILETFPSSSLSPFFPIFPVLSLLSRRYLRFLRPFFLSSSSHCSSRPSDQCLAIILNRSLGSRSRGRGRGEGTMKTSQKSWFSSDSE